MFRLLIVKCTLTTAEFMRSRYRRRTTASIKLAIVIIIILFSADYVNIVEKIVKKPFVLRF